MTVDEAAVIAAMPRGGRDLVDIVGLKPALALVREYGGTRLYVPRSLVSKAGRNVSRLLGFDAAELLVAARAGHQFDVPVLRAVELMLRDAAIRSDMRAGVPPNDLAERHQLTQRHVRRIAAKG